MQVHFGKGTTEYGPGVDIQLSGDEVAIAIDAYLVSHGIHVSGPRTITVNSELCESGKVYVDPSGFAIAGGTKYSGSGEVTAYYSESVDIEDVTQNNANNPRSS